MKKSGAEWPTLFLLLFCKSKLIVVFLHSFLADERGKKDFNYLNINYFCRPVAPPLAGTQNTN